MSDGDGHGDQAELEGDGDGGADDVGDGTGALGKRGAEVALHDIPEVVDVLLPERLVQPVGFVQPLEDDRRDGFFALGPGPARGRMDQQEGQRVDRQ